MAHPYTSHKLDPRSSLCVFVGYSDTQSAYYCLDPISNKIYVSLYVKFIEHSLHFSSSSMTAPPHTSSDTDEWCALYIPIISFAPTISVPSLQKTHSALSSLSFLGHWCQLYHPISSTPSPSPPPPSPPRPITHLQNNIQKPINKMDLHASLQPSSTKPTTITQALKSPVWRDAHANWIWFLDQKQYLGPCSSFSLTKYH